MKALRMALLAAAMGCGDKDPEASETGESSTGASSTTSSSTSTATSSTTTSTTASATESGSSGVDGSSEASSTGNPPACDFEQIVCDAAEDSKTPPIDCGFVTLDDDQAAWQAAYDCFRNAFLDQTAAKLLWQNMAVDSTNYSAMVAQVGAIYALLRFEYDDYMGDASGSVFGCSGITEDPMCMVDVGQMCLQCMDASRPTPICE